MTYSGDKSWTMTRDTVIEAALRKIGEYDSGESIPLEEKASASMTLNAIIKEMTAMGAALFLRNRAVLFTRNGFKRYSIPGDDIVFESDLVKTTTTAQATFGSLSLPINSWTTMDDRPAAPAGGWTLLAVDSNGEYQKGTITFVNTGTVVFSALAQINSGEANAAATIPSGATVYAYNATVPRPVRIHECFRRLGDSDTQVEVIGRRSYEFLSNKSTSGPITQVFFDPSITVATLEVWPKPDTDGLLYMITEHYSDDVDSPRHTPQFPSEWHNALTWRLAHELSYEYGIDAGVRRELLAIANDKLAILLNRADVENTSTYLGVG